MARYDKGAGGWAVLDFPRIGEFRPITSIAIDPSVPAGQRVYVTVGGPAVLPVGTVDRVWLLDTGPPPAVLPPGWPWAPAGPGLIDVQHNTIVLDPADPTGNRRWVGADLGVWTWNAGAGVWQVLSANLPDAAVLDLDLVTDPTVPAAPAILRATVHGRGVFELDLSGAPQPPVSLVLRATPVDRGRPARVGVALPGDHKLASTIDASPDIAVDAPDQNGKYVIEAVTAPTLVELRNLDGKREVLAGVPAAVATTRVHVTVRNRGVSPGNPPVDGVRVALLVGPAGADDATPAGPAATGLRRRRPGRYADRRGGLEDGGDPHGRRHQARPAGSGELQPDQRSAPPCGRCRGPSGSCCWRSYTTQAIRSQWPRRRTR